jgi:vancomycin resistance protein YoaR
MLQKARDLLKESYGKQHYLSFSVVNGYEEPFKQVATIEKKLRSEAWKVIIDQLGVRKILSVKRAEELDKQLHDWKDMPEITVQNVYDTMTAMVAQSKDFLEEAVQEVYKFLRPASSQFQSSYKTNMKNARWELGNKVIIPYAVSAGWGIGKYRANPYFEKNLVAVDKVFYALDSKGVPEGYLSPLVDAINTSESGNGETDYYKFKCYKNQNLHLEFKRMDLVAKLNQIAGGATLRGER